MSLVGRILFVYCIVVPGIYAADTCLACASPSLKENWELTGLPSMPTNVSNFFMDGCESVGDLAGVKCSGACFFGTFASASGEYAVVRGCVNEFIGNAATPDAGSNQCEFTSINRPVTVGKTSPVEVQKPVVGWIKCNDNDCNKWEVDKRLASDSKQWPTGTDWKCTEPKTKTQCVECQHFDGHGRCHHHSKSVCQGNYCTKLVGKLNNRWFEIRGCTALAPLNLETCVGYKKTFVIEQLSSIIKQSYWSTSCVCAGERCNSSVSHLISFSALFICAIALLKFIF